MDVVCTYWTNKSNLLESGFYAGRTPLATGTGNRRRHLHTHASARAGCGKNKTLRPRPIDEIWRSAWIEHWSSIMQTLHSINMYWTRAQRAVPPPLHNAVAIPRQVNAFCQARLGFASSLLTNLRTGWNIWEMLNLSTIWNTFIIVNKDCTYIFTQI